MARFLTKNDEIKELAILALKNAFYQDFSNLVNSYLQAGSNLHCDLENYLQEMSSVYSRETKEADHFINIWTQHDGFTIGHESISEALSMTDASEIHLQGKKIFERKNEDWIFTG